MRTCEHGQAPSKCTECRAARSETRKAAIAATKAARAARAARYRAECWYRPAPPREEAPRHV